MQSNDYNVINEKGEKLNAVMIANGDLLRVKFLESEDSKFITIVKSIKYIGVNGFSPLNLGMDTCFFGKRSKEIHYTDGIRYLNIGKDTIKFNTFRHYTMDLTKLGEEIIIFKNKQIK